MAALLPLKSALAAAPPRSPFSSPPVPRGPFVAARSSRPVPRGPSLADPLLGALATLASACRELPLRAGRFVGGQTHCCPIPHLTEARPNGSRDRSRETRQRPVGGASARSGRGAGSRRWRLDAVPTTALAEAAVARARVARGRAARRGREASRRHDDRDGGDHEGAAARAAVCRSSAQRSSEHSGVARPISSGCRASTGRRVSTSVRAGRCVRAVGGRTRAHRRRRRQTRSVIGLRSSTPAHTLRSLLFRQACD